VKMTSAERLRQMQHSRYVIYVRVKSGIESADVVYSFNVKFLLLAI